MLNPVICRIGGKRNLKHRIIKEIPEHDTYIEPFAGGMSVLLSKPKSRREVVSDTDRALMRFYRDFKKINPSDLRSCDFAPSREKFENEKKKLGRAKSARSNVCNYLYVNRRSYGCNLKSYNPAQENGGRNDRFVNLLKDPGKYQDRLKGVKLLSKDYRDVFKKYGNKKNSFTYMDPPFFESEGSKLYDKDGVTPRDVCGIAKKTKGKVLISYNNHPEVRKACKGLKIRKVGTKYRLQGSKTKSHKSVRELLISNY